MFEADLRIACKKPDLVKKSLEPDIENDKNITTEIKAHKDFVEINVKSNKLSYLKAVINSYMSLIGMLEEVEKVE